MVSLVETIRGARRERAAGDRTECPPGWTAHPAERSAPVVFVLSPRRLAATLGAGALALVVVHAGFIVAGTMTDRGFYGLATLFDVRQEANVPTAFSAASLLVCAVLLIANARAERHQSTARVWAVLASAFAYLAVDEAARIHEVLNAPLERVLGGEGVFRYGWVVPGALAVVVLLVASARLVLGLPTVTRRLVVAAAACYVGGGLGVEVLEAISDGELALSLLGLLEEALEMAGIVLFAWGFARHLADRATTVDIHLTTP